MPLNVGPGRCDLKRVNYDYQAGFTSERDLFLKGLLSQRFDLYFDMAIY